MEPQITFTVQQVVSILRTGSIQLRDARGPRRTQRGGMRVSRWQGSDYPGATLVMVSLINLDLLTARAQFDAAKELLAKQGAMIAEPNGPDALCLVVTN